MHFGLETTTLPLRVSIAVMPFPIGFLDERGKIPQGGSIKSTYRGEPRNLDYPL